MSSTPFAPNSICSAWRVTTGIDLPTTRIRLSVLVIYPLPTHRLRGFLLNPPPKIMHHRGPGRT